MFVCVFSVFSHASFRFFRCIFYVCSPFQQHLYVPCGHTLLILVSVFWVAPRHLLAPLRPTHRSFLTALIGTLRTRSSHLCLRLLGCPETSFTIPPPLLFYKCLYLRARSPLI